MDRLTEMTCFVRAVETGSFATAGRVLSMSPQLVGKRVAACSWCGPPAGTAHELVLEGGTPRGFQSGRLRLLLNGAVVPVDKGEPPPSRSPMPSSATTS